MTIAQFIVAYSVCWWLVLFMLLPIGANPPAEPGPGHAPSAPAKPMLKKKCLWATAIALLPTILIYFVTTDARAEDTLYHAGDTLYHAGSPCGDSVKYKPSADVAAVDGRGVGDKAVKSADLNGPNTMVNTDKMEIPLAIPSQNYIDRAARTNAAQNAANGAASAASAHNVDLSQSFINEGKLTITRDGDALLNGKPISNSEVKSGDCDDKK